MTAKLVLLPCQGEPLSRVWLPPSRQPRELVVRTRTSDTVEGALRRRAVELGLTPVLRSLAAFEIDVHVWICWVKPGEHPAGLVEVSAESLSEDAVFGRMIRKIREVQARP